MLDNQELPPPLRADIEQRDGLGSVGDVNFRERIITVVAVPYEQPAKVEFMHDIWDEIFERGAFADLTAPHRVRANRSHNADMIVGKAVNFWPDHAEGLVADIRIAKTPLGDETLELASEDMLSSSVGFGVRPQWQHLDRHSRTRRIKKAYLDHIAFVQSPAYENADVIGVRQSVSESLRNPQLIELLTQLLAASKPEPRQTPNLDAFVDDPIFRRTKERLNRQ